MADSLVIPKVPFIHVVTDYGDAGDLANAEVVQRLVRHVPHFDRHVTSVPPLDSTSGGFVAAQLALNSAIPGMLVFMNVAPRSEIKTARKDNTGERFIVAGLPNNVLLLGPASKNAFAFVAPHAQTMGELVVPSFEELQYLFPGEINSIFPHGKINTQFRSRDLFPLMTGLYLRNVISSVEIDPSDFALTKPIVGYVDGYDNIKTSITSVPYDEGTRIVINIGGAKLPATVTAGNFEIHNGEFSFGPGSSGSNGNRYYEVFLRGGKAAQVVRNILGEQCEKAKTEPLIQGAIHEHLTDLAVTTQLWTRDLGPFTVSGLNQPRQIEQWDDYLGSRTLEFGQNGSRTNAPATVLI